MIALMAVGLHGAALLADPWLQPGVAGITVPFALGYRPGFTAAGIVAGYLALLLGPTFYLRRRIGGRTWRRMHRATVVVWLLSVVHALGSGSDASSLWLRLLVLAPALPIVYAFTIRMLGGRGRRARAPRPQPAAAGGVGR
jgi:sulfoxide reductase heme-binding subunit YedZ